MINFLKYTIFGIALFYLICGIAFPIVMIAIPGIILILCIYFIIKWTFIGFKIMLKIATFGTINL